MSSQNQKQSSTEVSIADILSFIYQVTFYLSLRIEDPNPHCPKVISRQTLLWSAGRVRVIGQDINRLTMTDDHGYIVKCYRTCWLI